MLFVHMGSAAQGEAFLARFWPGAAAIADPAKALYRAFGLDRGPLGQMLTGAFWKATGRSFRKGNGVGVPVGDPLQMPGSFLLRGAAVVWSHEYRHFGDNPDPAAVQRAAGECA